MLKAKKTFSLIIMVTLASCLVLAGCSRNNDAANKNNKSPLVGEKNEEYYMVTFHSGIEYWKGCYKGFEDAGNLYGIKTIYTGGLQYDINQEVTALEQVIAKKPAGIAVTCINPNALDAPIKKAIEAGIPVVTFDADSPRSGRYSFLATNNEYAGEVAAKTLNDQVGSAGGEVVIITFPTQQNHEERVAGFKKALETKYKNLKLVEVANAQGDQTEIAKMLGGILQIHPNIKGVFCTEATSGVAAAAAIKEANKIGQVKIVSFDTDKGTLDAIKSGVISASIAQGTYIMGYQSMNFLYEIKHGLIKSTDGSSKSSGPLPSFVDTGVSVVTKDNVDLFYTK
ncbi:substrate-binding domain-containing protein [Clostridiaceae bacterium UIB06]|uniref:Substrate-binding domain-containing protein n=1 Tax=Clostridium thailandense TaxID=2794346 RepID=A0A949TX14_9CLOT|nr:substrate-binding domain-containing protein [Clostridium thailandense]MBV7272009.1 substrate-binding domain-containing protein [Clostridium thailandense]MCH5137407.1 substrate-binding domain-containing protein [Clostridiaceae bacterium UIB06]